MTVIRKLTSSCLRYTDVHYGLEPFVANWWLWKENSVFYIKDGGIGRYINTVSPVYNFYPRSFAYNEEAYFTTSVNGGGCVFKHADGSYVIHPSSNYFGMKLTENTDTYYVGGALIGSYSPYVQGVATGGADLTTVWNEGDVWKRTGATMYGTYAGVGAKAGTTKFIGWRTFDVSGTEYTEQNQDYNGYNVIKGPALYIWYDSGDTEWIISGSPGAKDSDVGYWNNATLTGNYTLVFTGSETAPTPSTHSVILTAYTAGDYSECAYTGEVTAWL